MTGASVSDAQPSSGSSDPASRRVVAVSSDPILLDLVRETLAELALGFVEVPSCAELEAPLCAPSTAFLLLDSEQAKGISAFVCLRSLRASGRSVPVLGVVASGGVEDLVAMFRLGANDVLRKPIRASELRAVLERLLPRAAP